VARRLRLTEPGAGQDLGIESAPLEELHGHLLSVALQEGSRMVGVEISELRMPPGAAVTLVVRGGKSFVPDPATVLHPHDALLVVATDQVRDAAERRLRAVDQGGKLAGWLGTRVD
jgi:cell volume regulation protein A